MFRDRENWSEGWAEANQMIRSVMITPSRKGQAPTVDANLMDALYKARLLGAPTSGPCYFEIKVPGGGSHRTYRRSWSEVARLWKNTIGNPELAGSVNVRSEHLAYQ